MTVPKWIEKYKVYNDTGPEGYTALTYPYDLLNTEIVMLKRECERLDEHKTDFCLVIFDNRQDGEVFIKTDEDHVTTKRSAFAEIWSK